MRPTCLANHVFILLIYYTSLISVLYFPLTAALLHTYNTSSLCQGISHVAYFPCKCHAPHLSRWFCVCLVHLFAFAFGKLFAKLILCKHAAKIRQHDNLIGRDMWPASAATATATLAAAAAPAQRQQKIFVNLELACCVWPTPPHTSPHTPLSDSLLLSTP